MTGERVNSAEVARLTSFSIRKVQLLAERGKIPSAARLGGGCWTFNRLRIEAWIMEEESRQCRATFTKEARSGGRATKFQAKNTERAYEQLLSARHSKGSPPSSPK
jgi:predicted DNA-binding transcriptional regulator AlpA